MRTILHRAVSIFLTSCLSFAFITTSAQSSFFSRDKIEFGFGAGPLVFLGDLGGKVGVGDMFLKDADFSKSKMVIGAYGSFYMKEWIGVRLAINQGKLQAADRFIEDKGGLETYRKDRNLQFQSNLTEAYLALEICPTTWMERYDGMTGKLRPYGVFGIGLFHFNPKGQYVAPDGTVSWVALQPLKLEGQGMNEYPDRKPYKRTQVEIPMGIGFKYFLKENFHLGIEVMHRKTFTDYIDDVSTTYIDNNLFSSYLTAEQAAMANQLYYRENFMPGAPMTRPSIGDIRGNPGQNDSFFSTTLRLGWRFINWDSEYGRQSRQSYCPTFF